MKWRYPKNLLRPVQSIEVPKYRLSWKPAPSKLKNAPPFLVPFGFRPKTLPAQLVFRSLEFGVIRTNTFKPYQMVFVSWSCQLVKMVFVRAPL